MTFDSQTAERIVLKALSSYKAGEKIGLDRLETEVGSIYGSECGVARPASWADWRHCLGPNGASTVHQVVWDLIVQRVLTVENAQGNYSWSTVSLTKFGAEVVAEQRWSPYDPDGYIKELRAQAPALTSLCQMYAEEALRCFSNGCYLATVVMLGAASEGIVNELFRRFVTALKAAGVPEAPSVQGKIEKEQSVYRKYEVFRKHFDPLVRPKLPPELGDDLNLQFDGVFNLIRFYRNDAGHPTGARIERMSAFTSLVLFVPYCKRVEDLVNWLDAKFGSLNT
jgi:hypothetical protein